MSYISQVNKGIEYIEANLFEDLSAADIAGAAGLSQWHFQRIFSALTNETLKGYVRARRLSFALKQLLTTERRILDIAVECGYESQESFTRAFQNSFQMTPGEFRKAGRPHLFMEKVRIDQNYLKHVSKNLSLTPELVEQPARLFVGLRTHLADEDADKNTIADKLVDLWHQFNHEKSEIQNAIAGVGYGLIQQTPDGAEGLNYFSTVEVTKVQDPLGAHLFAVELPRQLYARFLHKGPLRGLNHTVNYIYSSWLLNSDLSHTYGPDIEEYDRKYHEFSPDSEIHYMIPIRKESSRK